MIGMVHFNVGILCTYLELFLIQILSRLGKHLLLEFPTGSAMARFSRWLAIEFFYCGAFYQA